MKEFLVACHSKARAWQKTFQDEALAYAYANKAAATYHCQVRILVKFDGCSQFETMDDVSAVKANF